MNVSSTWGNRHLDNVKDSNNHPINTFHTPTAYQALNKTKAEYKNYNHNLIRREMCSNIGSLFK